MVPSPPLRTSQGGQDGTYTYVEHHGSVIVVPETIDKMFVL